MADARTTKILDTALWRFALQGVHATKTVEIATLAGVGVGTLFRTFPSKEALLQATYEHALQQLVAPMQNGVGEAQRNEYLHQLLERWWQLTAQAALTYREAFDLWRLVRTMPRAALPVAPLLGPFADLSVLVEEALARSVWQAEKGVPLSVFTTSLAAQWTAAVDVVLGDHACRADPALTTRVLTQAYKGWWQSLGLSTSLPAAWQDAPRKPRLKPKPETPLWALLLQAALVPPIPPPAPAPVGPLGQPRGLNLSSTILPPSRDEGPQK
jgi:AcrR family transcriptional regulator